MQISNGDTKDLLQQILDKYEIGVEVLSIQMKKVDPPEKVINAFRDVQSARKPTAQFMPDRLKLFKRQYINQKQQIYKSPCTYMGKSIW